MAKTVVHLTYSFNVGGLERVIVNLIQNSRRDNVRHVIITQTPGQALAAQAGDDVDFYCLDKQPGNDIRSHLRLYRLLRRLKPDVLHTYNFGTFEYQLVAWLARVPVRIHAEHGRDGEYDERVRQRRTLVRKLVLPFVNHFVVVSPDLHQWAQDSLQLRPPKLQFVYNGIDTVAFACNRQIDPAQPFTFIAVGRLAEVKNHLLLIDAFARLQTQVPQQARLQIVGDGPMREALANHITQLNLQQDVTLLGNRDDIPRLMCDADAFVLSSNYEAMPMTALEAMASGLPVIATDVGGVSNIVRHNVTGLLVPASDPEALANAMQQVMARTNDIIAMARRGQQVTNETYSADAMKRHYLQLYRIQ